MLDAVNGLRSQSQWPLVGRQQELAFVASTLEAPGRGVLLAGAAGVGKTRLARAALAQAADRGRRLLLIPATSTSPTVPLGAVAHLLPRAAGRTSDRAALFSRLTDALLDGDGPGRLVVGVDHVQLLDEMSAAFIHHVAAADIAPVVMTSRSGEPLPDAITSLYKNGLVERLEVQQLAHDEVRELLARVLGGDVAEQTLAQLWTASAGNVLYLHELVLDALDAGSMTARDGVWRWSGDLGPATRLSEVIGARLSGLGPAEIELVELLAVGEPLDVELVEHTLPEASLGDLERHGLIDIAASGRRISVRLSHPLYGEVLRARLGTYQHRRLCRRLAEYLEATGYRRPGDLVRLSYWRVESGTAHDAGRLAVAAEEANRIHDPAFAEVLARSSLQLETSFGAALQLAAALVEQARFDEAERVLREMEPLQTDDAGRKVLGYLQMRTLFYGLGRAEEADAALAGIEGLMHDRQTRLTLRGWRAMVLSHAGRYAEAADVAQELAATSDRHARMTALPTIAVARMLCGRVREATALVDECLGLGANPNETPLLAVALRVLTLAADGRLAEADTVLSTRSRLVDVGEQSIGDIALLDTLRGHLLLLRGRPRSALRQLRAATGLLRVVDAGGFLGWCLSQQVEAAALLGDRAAARAALEETAALPAGGVRIFDGAAARARAWYRGAESAWSAAAAETMAVGDRLAGRGELAEAIHALHDAFRLDAGPAVARRLATLVGQADGGLAHAVGLHVNATIARDLDGLEAAASAFETAGALLPAADIAAEAAQLAAARRLPRRATTLCRRALDLAGRCEGARTLRIVGLAQPDPLTRREREVATLAVTGLSNRDIAARLVTSVRTVESHLQQTYAKLGINNRAELPVGSTTSEPTLAR